MRFINRTDAGRQLADTYRGHSLVAPVVVGLSRGGVPVAAEMARELALPLEICVVRKLVARYEPPVAIGAVAEGGGRYLDEGRIRELGLGDRELAAIVAREQTEIARLSQLLRDRPPLDLRGCDVILVDDGAITGATILAAVVSLRARGVRRIELAIPVASSEALDAVRPWFDRVIFLTAEPMLVAVGARYDDFWPVSDAQVANLLAASRRRPPKKFAQTAVR